MTLITRNPALCKCENKGLKGIWAKNICIYMGVRIFGPFQFQKSRHSYTFFFLKKKGGLTYTWVRWKRGLFGTHICTKSYIGYPPPRFETIYCAGSVHTKIDLYNVIVRRLLYYGVSWPSKIWVMHIPLHRCIVTFAVL